MAPAQETRTPRVHVPSIDGYRGLASLLVLVFHLWFATNPPLDGGVLKALVAAGGLGVDFFFVISGFVLFLPVATHEGSFGDPKHYLLRRFARIAPAYYVALLIQGLARPMLTGYPSPFDSLGGLAIVGAHLVFLQHELPAWLSRQVGFVGAPMGFGINGAVWSLTIEVMFYVTLPLVAARFFRRPVVGLLVALAITFAWRMLAYELPSLGGAVGAATRTGAVPRLLTQFPSYFGHFCFGMLGALAFTRWHRGQWRRERLESAAPWLRATTLIALLAAMVARGNTPQGPAAGLYHRYLADMLPALLFAAMMTLSASAPARRPLMAHPVARWLGDVSYGVFLWHFPLVLLFMRTLGWVEGTGDAAFAGLLGLILPTSVVLAWLSRRWVEEPAIRWAHRRTANRASVGQSV